MIHGKDLPDVLPLLPVRDVVIFTDMLLPLFVGREKSVRAVEEAVSGPGFVFLCTQKDAAIENPSVEDIYRTGTVGRVLRMLKLPDGRVKKGMALERLGRKSQALVEYRYVVDRYPNSQAARIARERLTP